MIRLTGPGTAAALGKRNGLNGGVKCGWSRQLDEGNIVDDGGRGVA